MNNWEEVDWRRGAVEWPARSPDLNPLIFFLSGHLKTVLLKTPVENINQLREVIANERSEITLKKFSHCQSFIQRFYYCQDVEGNPFEHLI